MKVEIIFMDAAAPKTMEVDNEYVKGNMLCLRYGNMITKYPLAHIFSISHEHGPHIGSKAFCDEYMGKEVVDTEEISEEVKEAIMKEYAEDLYEEFNQVARCEGKITMKDVVDLLQLNESEVEK